MLAPVVGMDVVKQVLQANYQEPMAQQLEAIQAFAVAQGVDPHAVARPARTLPVWRLGLCGAHS